MFGSNRIKTSMKALSLVTFLCVIKIGNGQHLGVLGPELHGSRRDPGQRDDLQVGSGVAGLDPELEEGVGGLAQACGLTGTLQDLPILEGMNIADLRTDYARAALDEEHSDADAIRQFTRWWDEAMASQVREANAMTVATADADGRPGARTVLLKGYDERGFVFFTNYESRKGRELAANARACLLFFWPELERQVRIDGAVERASAVMGIDDDLMRPPALDADGVF